MAEPELQLVATSSDGAAVVAGAAGENSTLTVADSATVEFSLKSAKAMADPKLLCDTAGLPAPTDGKWKVTAKDGAGVYSATATLAGAPTPVPASPHIELKLRKTEPAPGPAPAANGDDSVLEVKPGRYDSAFARATGLVALCLAAAVLVISVVALVKFGNGIGARTVPKGETLNGPFESRASAVVILIATAIAALLLIAGSWLAALETRGRLRAQVTSTRQRGVAERGPLADALKEVPAILSSAAKMRGTIAVLVSGVAVLLGALWATTRLVDPGGTSPQPSSSAPASSAPSGTGSTATASPQGASSSP